MTAPDHVCTPRCTICRLDHELEVHYGDCPECQHEGICTVGSEILDRQIQAWNAAHPEDQA